MGAAPVLAGARIRLNDEFRRTSRGGRVVYTRTVEASPRRSEILEAVSSYTFQGIDDNNPDGNAAA